MGDPCVAVAGQVYEVHLLVDQKVVHLTGLAGGVAHPSKILPIQQTIDDRGFAHVGAAGHGDLGTAVPNEILLAGGGADKFRVV